MSEANVYEAALSAVTPQLTLICASSFGLQVPQTLRGDACTPTVAFLLNSLFGKQKQVLASASGRQTYTHIHTHTGSAEE